MYKPFLFLIILFTVSIQAAEAQDTLCTIDKLYYGQVLFDSDELENKSYEFYMHLPAKTEPVFYFHEMAKEKFRTLYFSDADPAQDTSKTYFNFGDASITLDTSSSLDLLTADIKIKKKFSKGLNTYDRDDSVNIILLSTYPQEITEILAEPRKNSISPRPFDRFDNYWATINILPGRNEYSFQGNIFTYLGKFDSEPYTMFTFTFPNISVVYDKNGYRRYSYQAFALPILGGFSALGFVLFDDQVSSYMFSVPSAIFAFLSGISNPGIDIPIAGENHYTSFYIKLNWDALIVEAPDVEDYEQPDNFFVEPKLGFRYMNVNGIGLEAFAGYRLWNFPLTLSHEHAFAGVSLLIPITDIE